MFSSVYFSELGEKGSGRGMSLGVYRVGTAWRRFFQIDVVSLETMKHADIVFKYFALLVVSTCKIRKMLRQWSRYETLVGTCVEEILMVACVSLVLIATRYLILPPESSIASPIESRASAALPLRDAFDRSRSPAKSQSHAVLQDWYGVGQATDTSPCTWTLRLSPIIQWLSHIPYTIPHPHGMVLMRGVRGAPLVANNYSDAIRPSSSEATTSFTCL